jgi:hypothetical protein
MYEKRWQWQEQLGIIPDPNMYNFSDKSSVWNRICAQGLQVSWSVNEQRFSQITKSRSALGDEGSVPGALRVYNGRQHYWNKVNYDDILKYVNK